MACILVIEDDPDLNDVLHYNLVREGHTVMQAYDGHQGIEVLATHRFDVVLLDIMLPGRDGWDVCDWLETHTEPRDLAVVFFTARATREDFDRARNRPHFAGYFIKPYTTEDVLRHVASVATSQRRAS